jgi:hypothetical protein
MKEAHGGRSKAPSPRTAARVFECGTAANTAYFDVPMEML